MSASKAGAKPEASAVSPFFIIGCVRSGTTMLRNALRMHPNLASPEETHFYRWAEPYGTEAYTRIVTSNPVLKRHREIDGITEEEFRRMVMTSRSRDQLYYKYMDLFVSRRKPAAKRWFDKTPQNVYGAALAAGRMERASFVHIVRHPVNVVASLRIGKVMKVDPLAGACNYWNEAVDTMKVLKRAYPTRVYELRYEDFARDPMAQMKQLLAFLDEPFNADWFADLAVDGVDHAESGVLSQPEIATVLALTVWGRGRYGYGDSAQALGLLPWKR
jgi:Sulfotransferase family